MEVQDNTTLVKELSLPLFQSKGWIKLLGVLMIAYGILIALSIVGLIIAWLPVWVGGILLKFASAIEKAQTTGDPAAMAEAMGRLKSYFTIMGVFTLIGLVLGILGFLGGLAGQMQ